MSFELPALPYERDALEPHISKETIDYHYGKHHQAYVAKLNAALKDSVHATDSLEAIVRNSTSGLFDNSAQVWNHSFYWDSMSPSGGGQPGKLLADRLTADFGSVAAFIEQFSTAALGRFGSGWAWLIQRPDGTLAITTTANADTPLIGPDTPLLTCDVWEHAYYIDCRNDRAAYLDAWWNVVNWEFAEANANLD
ncbi:MAG: superoxide dismutase [Gammaproteobacteria bacterium]|nr:superoxide dismutase [Gammaproteobacteria bacterium]